MDLPYAGYYINLERSVERRESLERQLSSLELSRCYTRFAALDGRQSSASRGALNGGEYGCFASHAQVLNSVVDGARHVHVLEDDVLLSAELVPFIGRLIAAGIFDQYDLLFTDIFVPLDPVHIRAYERATMEYELIGNDGETTGFKGLSVIDLKGVCWACMSSYFVAQRSLNRVADMLLGALGRGPEAPIDLLVRKFVDSGELKAAVCLPFLTSVDLTLAVESTINRTPGRPDLGRLACDIARQSFFVRPDFEVIRRIEEQYFPVVARTARRASLSRMMDFASFGEYEVF